MKRDYLIDLRKQNGYTISFIERELHSIRQTYHDIENGEKNMSAETALAVFGVLSGFFDVSVLELMELELEYQRMVVSKQKKEV